jgi:cell division protein ZapE
VLELGGARDYRADRMAGLDIYNTPLGARADAAMDAAWQRLTDGAAGAPLTLQVMGRPLLVPRAFDGVARFSVDELCGRPLGAADYIVLARNFHTLLIDGIPQFTEAMANEARRLTLLVDTLYDERAKLICSAAAPPGELLPANDKAAWFARTASRLNEMQSQDYLQIAPAVAG